MEAKRGIGGRRWGLIKLEPAVRKKLLNEYDGMKEGACCLQPTVIRQGDHPLRLIFDHSCRWRTPSIKSASAIQSRP